MLCVSLLMLLLALSQGSVWLGDFHFADERQEKFMGSLHNYQVVHPVEVDQTGALLSNRVTQFLHRLRRRDVSSPSQQIYYKISHQGKDLLFNLTLNRLLLSPGYISEQRWGNLTSGSVQPVGHNACHFVGSVVHTALGGGRVALSACNGLRGLFRLPHGDYFIEPIGNHSGQEEERQAHIVYKRHDAQHNRRKRWDVASEGAGACGVQDSTSSVLEQERQREKWEETRRKEHTISQRSVSKERWVETLVVADTKMIEYHGRENVESYIFTIINMVTALFHDPSIGNAIHIVLVRLILLEEEEEDLKIIHHGDHTLASFCKWQKNMNPKGDSSPHHHDVAVLLTRKDLCAGMNHPCETLGLSHISGICQPHRSCNINEDSGLPLAFTIAHELGHSFGIQHDGIGNDCEVFGKHHYIMSRQLQYDHSPLTWSSCSKDYITRFLDRGWGYCLNDPPTEKDLKLPIVAPGVLYDVHHQCQLQYGPNSTFCDEMDNICQTLWCSVNGTCRSKLDAAADGTRCGVNKWCFNGECVTVGNRPDTIDGGWGAWSIWTHCTRTCGAGVQAAERQCSNPVPRFGGKYCIGKRRRYRVCNTEACPPDKPSFRQMQCSEFDMVLYKNSLYTWVPVYNTVNPCELHCRPIEGEFSEKMLDAVIDGTLCYEIANKRDICINGICKTIGCDYEIESKAAEDQCGVCLGDGSACQTVTKTFEESEGLGYVDVGLIPEGARDIRVEEIAEAGNFLALRSEDPEKYFLNGGFVIQWNGDYKVAGTTFKYERNGNLENLTAPGPTKEPVWIQLLFQETNPGIRYEYTIKKDTDEENTIRQLEFSWEYGLWTRCSALCGTGVRRQIVRCVEKTSGVVEDRFCNPRSRPDNKQQKCNEPDCPARWWAGEWQKCSKACGFSGVKKRTVLCIQTVGLDEQALPVSECKHLPRPRAQLPCNRDILCSSNWTVGIWGECSASCGGGFRTRTVNCTRPVKGSCVLSKKPNARGLCALRTCPTKKKVLLPPQRPKWGKPPDKNAPDKHAPNKKVPRAGLNHSGSKDEAKLNRMSSTVTTTSTQQPGNTTVQPDSRTDTNKGLSHQPTDRDERQKSDRSSSDKDFNSIAFHHVTVQDNNSTGGWRAPEPVSIEPTAIESEGMTGQPIEVTAQWDGGQFLVTEVGVTDNGRDYGIEEPSTKPGDSENPTVTEKPTLASTVTPGSLTLDISDPSLGDIQRKPGISGAKTDPKVKPVPVRLREKLQDLLNPARFTNNTGDTNSSSGAKSPNTASVTPLPGIALPDLLETNSLSSSESQPTGGIPNKARVTDPFNLTADYNGFETEGNEDGVFWKVGNWSECSTTCGVGAVWRHIECSAEGDSGCEKIRKPDPARRCFVRPCATWKIGNWTKCSESCGTGSRIRSVQCNDSHKNRPLRPFHCQLLGRKPDTSLDCNLGACVEWRVSAWSECSKTCGSGIQERLIYCPENALCSLKEKPPLAMPCSAQPCTEWLSGSWGQCSVSCGGGLQHRLVKCVSMGSNRTEHEHSQCQHLPPPGLIQKCNAHTCVSNKGAPCVRDRMSAKFCLTLKKLDRCVVATIRTQCCHTCHGVSSLASRRGLRPAFTRRHSTSS